MKRNVESLFLILWVSSNFFGTFGQEGGNPGPGPNNPDYPQEYDLWCLFCRSDRNSACINKAADNAETLTQPCTNQTLHDFAQDLKIDPPDRPVLGPRTTGVEFKWACYRLYTVDQTFTMRTCTRVRNFAGTKEECRPCTFDKVNAMCCTCPTSNCNSKNSDATRIMFEKPVIIIIVVLLSIKLLFH